MFFVVAAVHFTRGLQADVLLGAVMPDSVLHDPVLDSQNRFYGTSFALYGVLLLVGVGDLQKYATVVRCTLWCLFAGGIARLVSIAIAGMPTKPVLMLLASELLVPPLTLWWLRRHLTRIQKTTIHQSTVA